MRARLDRGVLAGGDGRFERERVTDGLSAAGNDLAYRLAADGEAWMGAFGIDLDALGRAALAEQFAVDLAPRRLRS